MPEPDHDTRAFWIDQIIAGLLGAAGLDIRHDYFWFGWIVFAIGLCWLVYLRWEGKPMTPQIRTPNLVAVMVLFVASVVIGYDIYDRHNGVPTQPNEIVRQLNQMELDWGSYKFKEIYNYPFSHETVRLDGKKFINCTFDNVTFEYEGTGPFDFDPYPPTIEGDIKMQSDVPIVKATFNACLLGCRPITKSVVNTPALAQ